MRPRFLSLFFVFLVLALGACDTNEPDSTASSPPPPPPPPPSIAADSTAGLYAKVEHSALPGRTATGFFYPTGTVPRITTEHLESGCPPSNSYVAGKYHLGNDIGAEVGAPVYAIADGVVARISTGGWGDRNVALLIRHQVEDDQEILAVYGHIRNTKSNDSRVDGGDIIGYIGPYPLGSHLHFGIRPDANDLGGPLGMGDCNEWPEAHGFVDAIKWMKNHAAPPQQAIEDQARGDMLAFGGRESRLDSPSEDWLTEYPDWHPEWELWAMPFRLESESWAWVFHATYVTAPSYRFVLVWTETKGHEDWIPVES